MFPVHCARHPVRACAATCALAAAVCLLALSALAGKASFGIPTTGVIVNGAADDARPLIKFHGGLISQAFVNFRLPGDYQKDTPVRLAISVAAPVAPCSADMHAASLIRSRKGALADKGLAGVSPADGTTLVSMTVGGRIAEKVFVLKPAGLLPGLKPRDAITVTIQRDGLEAGDTCDVIEIHGIDVRYATK